MLLPRDAAGRGQYRKILGLGNKTLHWLVRCKVGSEAELCQLPDLTPGGAGCKVWQ